jgi:uncharacterized protein (DUF433 family)
VESRTDIVFRTGPLGRRAAVSGTRLDVWQVVETVRNCSDSIGEAADYLALQPESVEAAMAYYALHRAEIDEIATREREAAERAEARYRAGLETSD